MDFEIPHKISKFDDSGLVAVNRNRDYLNRFFKELPKVKQTESFVFNYANIQAHGKPTRVERGVFNGWSLPIYATDDEELFTCDCLKPQWDGTTDPIIYLGGWLPSANTAKRFKLQVSVETADFVGNDTVPTTTNDYTVETLTGTWGANTSFKVQVTVDASAIGLAVGQPLAIRVRRLAKAGAEAEITGEVIIEGIAIEIVTNKFGGAV